MGMNGHLVKYRVVDIVLGPVQETNPKAYPE